MFKQNKQNLNFKKMKKFEIIEEGRLNKSEMNEITGGAYTCRAVNNILYSVTTCGEGKSYSNCPSLYNSSCTPNGGSWFLSCQSFYQGPTGTGGISVPTGPGILNWATGEVTPVTPDGWVGGPEN